MVAAGPDTLREVASLLDVAAAGLGRRSGRGRRLGHQLDGALGGVVATATHRRWAQHGTDMFFETDS